MIVSRRPRGHLGTLIELLWASDAPFAVQDPARPELVLPTGCVHLAIRLAGRSLRLFKGQDDLLGTLVDSAVIGGARSSPYIKEVSEPVPAVGVLSAE